MNGTLLITFLPFPTGCQGYPAALPEIVPMVLVTVLTVVSNISCPFSLVLAKLLGNS